MFKQLIEVKTSDPDALVDHVNGYDRSAAVGLEGVSLYADRGRDGVYFIEAVFSSREEAKQNSGREDTATWAARLRELVTEDPYYCDLEPVGGLVASGEGA